MRALILVVSAEKKGVSSTTGMQATVATSSLSRMRSEELVPRRMEAMEGAIAARDFETFAQIAMKESNSFHATCLDTSPPIFYLNDVSRAAIRVVEGMNERAGKAVAAYTFDAGPNAVVYYLEENQDAVAGLLKGILGEKEGWSSEQGRAVRVPEGGELGMDRKALEVLLREGVSRVILTGVGEGPISVDEHLIDERGEPIES